MQYEGYLIAESSSDLNKNCGRNRYGEEGTGHGDVDGAGDANIDRSVTLHDADRQSSPSRK